MAIAYPIPDPEHEPQIGAHASTPDIKRPHYGLRRLAAAGVAGLTLVGGGRVVAGAADMVSKAHDRQYGTDVPSAEDIAKHGAQKLATGEYVERTIKPSDRYLSSIASEYTPDSHDIRSNISNLASQQGGSENAITGDTLIVPATTVPPEKRGQPSPDE